MPGQSSFFSFYSSPMNISVSIEVIFIPLSILFLFSILNFKFYIQNQ